MTEDAPPDRFNLARFMAAQDVVWPRVVAELRAGAKTSHWMWFVFPQVSGLGYSAMSRAYAVSSLEEAQAYLAHPVLGTRLRECIAILLSLDGRSAHQIFDSPDDQKLHSSLTLFCEAGGGHAFKEALRKYFSGAGDTATLRLLSGSAPG